MCSMPGVHPSPAVAAFARLIVKWAASRGEGSSVERGNRTRRQCNAVRAILFACIALALSTVSAPAAAQSNRHVTLGPGAGADRRIGHCGRTMCFAWQTTGFTTMGLTGQISDIASTRTDRIVAATSTSLMYTDDRGANWRPARGIEGRVFAVAFDAGSHFGVAVGDGGRVWTTEDGGLNWRNVRDDTGVMLVRVCVVGHVIVMASAHGAVWMSTDGGTSVRMLLDAPASTMPDERVMDTFRGAIWIRNDVGDWLRVTPDGAVDAVTG